MFNNLDVIHTAAPVPLNAQPAQQGLLLPKQLIEHLALSIPTNIYNRKKAMHNNR